MRTTALASAALPLCRGYARQVLLNTSTAENPDLRLKKPGGLDSDSSAGSITSCDWNTAADATT
ncbi:hypothetical protein AB0M38_29635 [Streptomyces sp. NPDC051742]|uniref:hypothetical protein n=1 Tax=unclassified Streptomyces TaxID=2593676 RepID=UPI00341E4E89